MDRERSAAGSPKRHSCVGGAVVMGIDRNIGGLADRGSSCAVRGGWLDRSLTPHSRRGSAERDSDVGGGAAVMGIDRDIGGVAGWESGCAVRGGWLDRSLTPHSRRRSPERDSAVGGGAAVMGSGRFIRDSGAAGRCSVVNGGARNGWRTKGVTVFGERVAQVDG
jgi:hypothetical protein